MLSQVGGLTAPLAIVTSLPKQLKETEFDIENRAELFRHRTRPQGGPSPFKHSRSRLFLFGKQEWNRK